MSGEPKTLTPQAMTLEEFLAELGNERNASLARYKYPDGTEQWAVNDSWSNQIVWAHTWPELATKALGVRVVARDEAAELRAGITAVVKRLEDAGFSTSDNWDALLAIVWDLRRLAGGENEK